MPTEVTTSIPTVEVPPSQAPDLTPAMHISSPASAPSALESKGASKDTRGPAPTTTTAATAPVVPMGVEGLLAQLKSLPVAEVDALLDAIDRETGAGAEEEEDEGDIDIDDSSVSRKGPVRYSEVEPGVQKAIAAVHNRMMEDAVAAALDSDKDLSYNLSSLKPAARQSVIAIVKDQMERQIGAEGDRFDYNWVRVAQHALAKTKPTVEPFFERPTPRAGMGPGSGSDHYMSRPMAEPKRIPAFADADDYANYIAERLRYNAQNAERETQSQVPGV